MMPEPPDAALPLPGLEDLAGKRAVSDLERGVRRTLAELARLGKLEEVHAGYTAIAVAAAQEAARKSATGRGSTWSNDVRVLVELLDALTGAGEAGDDFEERMRQKMAEWEAELAGEQPGPGPQ